MPARLPDVAIVAHHVGGTGGMERVLHELLQSMPPDLDVAVVSRTIDPVLASRVSWYRVRCPAGPFPLMFASFAVLASLRLWRLRPRLIHVTGALVLHRADLATVHYCHSAAARSRRSDSAPGLRSIYQRVCTWMSLALERWAYRPTRLGLAACVSHAVEREIRRAHPGLRTVVTPNGVDHGRFHPDDEARASVCTELGIDSNRLVVSFVGGDWARKGLPVLVEAVMGSDTQPVLLVIGEGNTNDLPSYALESPRIHFLGRRSDVERYLAASDVFVFPSRYEANPLVVLEAAATGLVLVLSEAGNASELFVDGESTVITEASAESIIRHLDHLAMSPDVRAALGTVARRKVRDLTWERTSAATTELYRSMLEAGRSLIPPSAPRVRD